MKKIFNGLLLAGLLLCYGSCKDYLDMKSDNTLAVPTSLDDFQALMRNAPLLNQLATPSLLQTWADEYFSLSSRFESLDLDFQRLHKWEIEELNHPNDWSSNYRPVYYANFCLEGLPKVERTEANKVQYDRVKGTALFFRAYFYLKLLWAFSPAYDEATAAQDLGIVLKVDTDFNTRSVRSSVAAGYAKLLQDAEEALALLPALADIPTQPSKLAAQALLARAYLSMRKYDKALFHSDEALKINDGLMDYNKPEDGVNAAASIPFQKYNKETIFYTEMNDRHNGVSTVSFGGRIDTNLYASYEEHDLRKQLYFTKSGDYYELRASYTGTNFRYFTGLAFDELYLIRAECRARANDVKEAMQDLNHLLRYRYDNKQPFVAKTAQDAQEALDSILLERKKSLIFRGLRFVDIKRLNNEGYGIIIKRRIDGKEYVLPPNDPRYVLPLPNNLRPFVD